MASVFTRIIRGELPCYKIAEDARAIAFLDIQPLKRGHALVVPKTEVDLIFDLESAEYIHLFQFARKLANAMKQSIDCERIAMAVLGMEVPHAHIHLVPIDRESDLRFNNPRVELSADEFWRTADQIAKAWSDLGYARS